MELKDKFMKIIAKYTANYPDLTEKHLQEALVEELVVEVNFTYVKAYESEKVSDLPKRVFTGGVQAEIEF